MIFSTFHSPGMGWMSEDFYCPNPEHQTLIFLVEDLYYMRAVVFHLNKFKE